MILAALAAASAMTGMGPQILLEPIPPRLGQAPPPIERTPNLYRPPANCSDLHRQVVERQKEELKKLNQLPNAIAQYAVVRMVGGCGVPTPVGYHPGYLAPGAADPQSSETPKP